MQHAQRLRMPGEPYSPQTSEHSDSDSFPSKSASCHALLQLRANSPCLSCSAEASLSFWAWRQVCGNYYQGRGQHTHAFTHALETAHHMFMKLEDGRVYCLPDGYEVEDRSLDPIRYVLNPTFAPEKAQPLLYLFLLSEEAERASFGSLNKTRALLELVLARLLAPAA